MLTWRKQTAETMRRFLARQAVLNFTWSSVGKTARTPPPGYIIDHTRIKLREGETVFSAASVALQRLEQFYLGLIAAWSPFTRIASGEVAAVIGWAIGMWWLRPARIMAVVNESGPISRFGFAYGTLPGRTTSGLGLFFRWCAARRKDSYKN